MPDPACASGPAPAPRRASLWAVLLLLGLVLVEVLPALSSRDLWAFDEVSHADVVRNLVESGHLFALRLNGVPYPDKPPLYFWLVASIRLGLGTTVENAFFLAAGLGGLLFLLATWRLARVTVARDRPHAALLAPLLVLVTPLFQILLRTTRMDLLFGALIVAAEVLLYRGLVEERPRGSVVLAGAVAALAALVKGPLGILFPAATAVCFLAWRGRLRRLLRRDVGLACLAAVLLLGAWAAALVLAEGWPYVRDLLRTQVYQRALHATSHRQPFWFYAATLPLLAVPWTLLLVGLRFAPRRIRAALSRAVAGRRTSPPGRAWLAWAALSGFVLLSAGSSKFVIYVLPLFAPLAVLGADFLSSLPARPLRRVWTWIGWVGVLLALGLAATALWPPWPFPVPGVPWLALVLGVVSGLVVFLRGRSRGVVAGTLVAGLSILYLVAALETAPGLDPVMSPRRQAEALAAWTRKGYAPLVFMVYRGAYAYHAGRSLPETKDPQALASFLARHDRVVVAMPEKYWRRDADILEGLAIVQRQRIEARPYVLAVRPPPPDAENAPR